MEKPLRQQLIEALQDYRRQIELLVRSQAPGPFNNPHAPRQDNSREIKMMEIEYRRLAQALADLGPDDA